MFAPSSLDQQLAATWNAARTDARGRRAQRSAPRRRVFKLVRAGR
jgi:hypothetical protein